MNQKVISRVNLKLALGFLLVLHSGHFLFKCLSWSIFNKMVIKLFIKSYISKKSLRKKVEKKLFNENIKHLGKIL